LVLTAAGFGVGVAGWDRMGLFAVPDRIPAR